MYKYFAFISYSHDDKTYARMLQEKLEFYGLHSVLSEIKRKKNIKHDETMIKMVEEKSKGKSVSFGLKQPGDRISNEILDFIKNNIKTKLMKFKEKMYPMCRDDGEFAPGEDLKKIIFDHIDASKKLILLCSESSIDKPWVKEEFEHFIQSNKGKLKNIIFVNISNNENFIDSLKEFLKPYYGDNAEPLIVPGREKNSHLEIISGLLGVDKSVVFDREKARIRKRITKIAIVTLISLLSFCWFFCGYIVNSKVDEALKTKNDDLSKSISLLLDAKTIANNSLHNDERVIAELENICDFDCGQVLSSKRFDNNYYSNTVETINEEGNLHYFRTRNPNDDDIVFDSNTGKEFARYNHNSGTLSYSGYGNKNKTVRGISSAQGDILKIDKNHMYIYTNNYSDDTQQLHIVTIENSSLQSINIPSNWYNWQLAENGIYYLQDGSLYFCTFEDESKLVKENVNQYHITDDEHIITDENGAFCGIPECTRIIASPNNENLYVLTKDGIYCFNKSTYEYKYTVNCNGNILKFSSNGIVIVGSGNSFENNCEYSCFLEKDGTIIKSISSWTSPAFNISNNGKYIAYKLYDKIIVEELSTGKTFEVVTDNAIVACGFRSDSTVLWGVTTRGEFFTWAVSPDIQIPEIFNEIIFDINDNNICWVSDENNTYRYNKKTNELTPILDKGVSFASQSDNEIELKISIPESIVPVSFFIDKKTDLIIEKKLYKSKDELYNVGKEEKKYSKNSVYSQYSGDGKYLAEYISDSYYNSMQKFQVIDMSRNKLMFEIEFTEEFRYPFDGRIDTTIPIFDEKSERLLICYEDANDLKLKTKVYSISGNELATYTGKPIYLKGQNKYWNDELILLNGKTINEINVFSNKIKVVERAKEILNHINNSYTLFEDIVMSSADNECFKFNTSYNFSDKVDVNAMPAINLLHNDNLVPYEKDKIIKFKNGDIFAVDTVDINGIYETSYWIDDNINTKTTYTQTSNPLPIVLPMESKDGQEHILHIKVVSYVGNTDKKTYRVIFNE